MYVLCVLCDDLQDNRIVGKMQLFSVEKNVSQPIDAHACCFIPFKVEGATTPSTIFVFANRAVAGGRVRIHMYVHHNS